MKQEKIILTVTLILNFIIATIKLVCGIVFNFSSLVADSLHSFTDAITDIISAIANHVGKKRANKRYPFGYGMIENLSNLFIGIILVLLGIYIFIESFKSGEAVLNNNVYIVLIITIILKLCVVITLYMFGKKLKNNSFLVSARESLIDLVASIIVLIVSILLLFKKSVPIFQYADMVGSILISLIIFYLAFRIIIENIEYLLGKCDTNNDIINKIEAILKQNKRVKNSNFHLMKFGNYYNLFLNIEVDDSISLKQLFNLENKLKKEIRQKRLKIRLIEIEVKPYKVK